MSRLLEQKVFTALALACFCATAAISSGAVPTAAAQCGVSCATGEMVGCSSGWHVAWDGEDNVWAGGTHPDDCHPQSCSNAHGLCPAPEAEFTTAELITLAESAAAASEVSHLIGLIGDEQVALNARRAAIQVTNCRGEVVAHLPVPAEIAVALERVGPTAENK